MTSTPPAVEGVYDYLGRNDRSQDSDVQAAYDAEVAAQARWLAIPDGDYPADLTAALFRRVARNLALQGAPLGIKASIGESAIGIARVGGLDPEIERLEAPYRTIGFA